ncbi:MULTISPECIES: VOC family protein [Paenibacillus]|uniref:VOC family protein n=1 Tax=Paenibacillus TaxID=44249 RepID=UPI002FE2D1E7
MSFQVTPFIMLNGQAEEAIRFYETALGAKTLFKQTYGEAPDASANPLPAEFRNRLAHSVLKIGDADLFVADSLETDKSAEHNETVQVCITTPDAVTTRHFFDALTQGGKIVFPLQQVHFSPAYGMVKDRFGVTFHLFTQRR